MRLTEAMRKKQCCYADARGDGRLAECTTSLQPGLYVTGWVCRVVCDALPALQRAATSACVKG